MYRMLLRLCAWSVVGVAAAAQTHGADAPAMAAAVAEWLASDQTDEAMLQRTVAVVLQEPRAGLQRLGERLRPALANPTDRQSKGLTALATHVLLDFVRRARASGMVFRGQYDPLLALQPFASELLFHLLLATPDWFPDTHRRHLVPVLRDLQPTPPAEAALLGVIDLEQNREIEPADLRLDLACLLWQWGRKEYVQPQLAQLRAASTEGDAEDRVVAMRQLAQLWYQLREYGKAAATHAAMDALAGKSAVRLTPTDWYWAACCHALAGDVERGIAALQRCVEQQSAPAVDSSLKLPRTLFEQDPEIARLRADPRFPTLLERAFPKPAKSDGDH